MKELPLNAEIVVEHLASTPGLLAAYEKRVIDARKADALKKKKDFLQTVWKKKPERAAAAKDVEKEYKGDVAAMMKAKPQPLDDAEVAEIAAKETAFQAECDAAVKNPKLLDRGERDELQKEVDKLLKEEGIGSKGTHFYLIEFEPGEVVMPQGSYSDFVGLLVKGAVDAFVRPVNATPKSLKTRDCWVRPRPWRFQVADWLAAGDPKAGVLHKLARPFAPVARRLLRLSDDPTGELALSRPQGLDEALAGAKPVNSYSEKDPFDKRFIGVTSVLWNRPRSATIVANVTTGCTVLTIKRKFIKDVIEKQAPAFIQESMRRYFKQSLAQILSGNRLFRPTIYATEVREAAWPLLLERLGPTSTDRHGRHFRALLDDTDRRWIDGRTAGGEFGDSDRHRLVRALNRVIKLRKYYDERFWSKTAAMDPVAEELISEPGEMPDGRRFMLHRRLFAAAWPDVLDGEGLPGDPQQVRMFLRSLVDAMLSRPESTIPVVLDWTPKEEREKKHTCTVFKSGSDADAVYFTLQGRLRVVREVHGGTMLLNTLTTDGYFGEAALKEGQTRGATVEAVTRSVLLKVPADILRTLTQEGGPFDWVRRKLELERERMAVRDADFKSMRRRPPVEPPQAIVERLQRTTNLLLIDMDLCTRCDQCVRACGEAHGDRPRFHRANPDFRFGKWEVAAACMHCIDAPCQYVCPVGAITFLDSGAVQVHRNRCIGCELCAKNCPFDVIDMYDRIDERDGPCVKEDKETKTANVANKCDLCLTPHDPPCVAACPYSAIQRGRPEELFPEFNSWAEYAHMGSS